MAKRKGKNEKLPETLYVHYEGEPDEAYFLSCSADSDLAACMNQTRLVGVYKLERIAYVVNKTTLEPPPVTKTRGISNVDPWRPLMKWDMKTRKLRRKKRTPAVRRKSDRTTKAKR